MMYFGFPLEHEECCRLLKIETTSNINSYLASKHSRIWYEWIDKNVGVLALPMRSSHEYIPFDIMISYILDLKHEFCLELSRLNVDTSKVYIAHMEDEEELVEFPDPYVLHF